MRQVSSKMPWLLLSGKISPQQLHFAAGSPLPLATMTYGLVAFRPLVAVAATGTPKLAQDGFLQKLTWRP